MTNFDRALEGLFVREGGFSNQKADRGGATRFGITEAVARANGYFGPMELLPEALARKIAKTQYWDTLRLDAIADLSYPLAEELFDTGYNCGVGIAGRFLQQSLNALNRQAKDYPDVSVDGLIGPVTLHALRLFLGKRGLDGHRVLLRALNALQGARYIAIAEANPTQETFAFGWFLNRVI